MYFTYLRTSVQFTMRILPLGVYLAIQAHQPGYIHSSHLIERPTQHAFDEKNVASSLL